MEKRLIQVLKPVYRVEECLAEIRECLESGWTGLGGKCTEFEDAWKKYTGLNNAHMVNSGTAGLHLAINILKEYYSWKDGDEIISTPITFISTNHAILYERLTPVFADVDDTLCLDVESIESKITNRTRAVMFVGVGGRVGQLSKIADLCKSRGLKLILDGAHMAGTRQWQKHVGQEADVAVFSFQTVKNLPTADAGMICFRDQELDARARKMSWLGIDKDTFARSQADGRYKWKYDVPYVGFKYHSNSIMASIGLVQLKYLDQDNQFRRRIASLYDEAFEGYCKIWPIHDEAIGVQCSQHIYQITVPDRDKLIIHLNQAGIYPGVHYVDNTNYPMYRHMHQKDSNADILSNQVLTLPCHLGMTEDDIDRVAAHVKKIV